MVSLQNTELYQDGSGFNVVADWCVVQRNEVTFVNLTHCNLTHTFD